MSQGQEVVLLWDVDWQQPSDPRWLCTAPRHPSCRGSKPHHIPGVGGGPLDAFPGLPLLRHKASFLPSVPQLPRGARGAWLGVEGGLTGCNIPMLSPGCWVRAMRRVPDSQGPRVTPVVIPTLLKGGNSGAPRAWPVLVFTLRTDLQTQQKRN